MKLEVHISGQTRIAELEREAGGWRATIDGQSTAADVVEVAPNTFSVLLAGQSSVRVLRRLRINRHVVPHARANGEMEAGKVVGSA